MKILFVTISFYEYINVIQEYITKVLDAEVDTLNVQWNGGSIEKMINVATRWKYGEMRQKYMQKKFFLQHTNTKYDYIFVLVGRGLVPELFGDFIKTQPQAKKIIYLWDDVARINNFHQIQQVFNKVYSFDKVDCEKYGFRFLPLFFLDKYRYKHEKKDIDFSCTGGWHSDRLEILDKLTQQYGREEYCWNIHLSAARSQYLFKRLAGEIKGKRPEYLKFRQIPLCVNAEILKKSKIVIDMPYASQNGLSIRTLESLAAKTKLVTTNANVKQYDFYNPQNVCIIDRNNPVIDEEFVNTEWQEIQEEIVEKYSLENWIKTIFSEAVNK